MLKPLVYRMVNIVKTVRYFDYLFAESVTMQNLTAVGHTISSYMCYTPFTIMMRQEQGGIVYDAQWTFVNTHLQAFNVDNATYSDGLFLFSTHALFCSLIKGVFCSK